MLGSAAALEAITLYFLFISPSWADNEEDGRPISSSSVHLRRSEKMADIDVNNTLTLHEEERILTRCSDNEKFFNLQLTTDEYGFETSWELKSKLANGKWKTIESGPPPNSNYADNARYTGGYCLPPGRYAIIMYDLFADGICCKHGNGGYSGYVDGNKQFAGPTTAGEKWKKKVHGFTVAAEPTTPALTVQEMATRKPTRRPTPRPSTARPTGICETSFTVETYYSIERDIKVLMDNIRSDRERSHFLGGIVRLAAHDFMDYNPRSSEPMGPDGCFDANHRNNRGLETIWCTGCELTMLHRRKYSSISRADFWVSAANAVVHLTSVNNALDLRDTFRWGRKDRASCRGSGERIPRPSGCDENEDVFIRRLGLEWKDAVALLGGHTIGRGERNFSGHEGTWSKNDQEAQIFDKQYYVEMTENAWRTRNRGGPRDGGPPQDWTTGAGSNNGRMFLNTDICLAHDINEGRDNCCTRVDKRYPDGQNKCIDRDASRRRCPRNGAAREEFMQMAESVGNNHFYRAYADAWRKATTVGQSNLSRLTETCEPE